MVCTYTFLPRQRLSLSGPCCNSAGTTRTAALHACRICGCVGVGVWAGAVVRALSSTACPNTPILHLHPDPAPTCHTCRPIATMTLPRWHPWTLCIPRWQEGALGASPQAQGLPKVRAFMPVDVLVWVGACSRARDGGWALCGQRRLGWRMRRLDMQRGLFKQPLLCGCGCESSLKCRGAVGASFVDSVWPQARSFAEARCALLRCAVQSTWQQTCPAAASTSSSTGALLRPHMDGLRACHGSACLQQAAGARQRPGAECLPLMAGV